MNKKINGFPITVVLTCTIGLFMILYGRISPLVSVKLGIYIAEAKFFVGSLVFTIITASLLNLTSERLTYFHIFINVAVCMFIPSLILIYDKYEIFVIIICSFVLIGTLIIFLKRKGKGKTNIIFYFKNLVFVILITLVIPTQFFLMLDEGVDYIYTEKTFEEEKPPVAFSELKEKMAKMEWGKLDLNEKTEVLAQLVSIEAEELGLKKIPRIEVKLLEKTSTYAFYDKKSKMICLNAFQLGKSKSISESVSSVTHELFHAYQMELIEKSENIPEEMMNFKILKPVADWKAADESYNKERKNFDGYYNNRLEVDARAFALEIVEKYSLK